MKAVTFKPSDVLLKMRFSVFLWIALFLGVVPSASAQDIHSKIRSSLVILKATALDKMAQPVNEALATGFIVSTDGFILTAYHLISDLGDIKQDSLHIEATFENATHQKTSVVDLRVGADLLLLKLPTPPADKPYAKLTLGNAYRHPEKGPIYTSGYANGTLYRQQEGMIESRDGPVASLWITSMPAQRGESGSPVYNGRGQVIGVVKGTDDTINYMVPIEFADNLLSYIRFLEIRDAMSEFDALRERLMWEAEVKGNTIIISYEKLVPGEPYVKEIDVYLRGVPSNSSEPTPPRKFSALKPVAANGRTGHSFEFPRDPLADWRHGAEEVGLEFNSLELIVVAKLTNDQKVRPQKLAINYKDFKDRR